MECGNLSFCREGHDFWRHNGWIDRDDLKVMQHRMLSHKESRTTIIWITPQEMGI